MNKITDKDIKRAYDSFYDFSMCPPVVCPLPTRTFEVGEKCCVGNLDECIVVEVLEDGKAYRIDSVHTATRVATRVTHIWWWHEIHKLYGDNAPEQAPEMFKPYLPGQISTTSMDSLFHKMSNGGLVCDPRYQRGYVWSVKDQTNLIDSIFNRMTIGSFIFARHSGYLHAGDGTYSTYINFDGLPIAVAKKNDYVNAVVDGQQRLTTLWRFYTGMFAYRGYTWDRINDRDRHQFLNSLVSVRVFDEDDVDYVDVLKMFICTNMGVPQDESHLETVRVKLAEAERED